MISVKRQRGRPRDPSKKLSIIVAARMLLLDKGPDVTTDEIAAYAGVAKATLYANFKDKEALIEAVIRRESDLTISDEDFEKRNDQPFPDVLRSFGKRFVSFINHRELLGWDRLIALASLKHPELTKRFYAAGPGRAQKLLIAIISEGIEKRQIKPCNPDIAADALSGLWLGMTSVEIKLGAKDPLTEREIEDRVSHGLDIFLLWYGTGHQ